MANKKSGLLTQAELSLMNVFWERGESSIRQVRQHITNGETIPYTTVAAIVRILAKKNFLHQRLDGKTIYYKPAIIKKDYESRTVDQLVKRLFNNIPVNLALRLIDDHDLTAEEIIEIKSMLDSKLERITGEVPSE